MDHANPKGKPTVERGRTLFEADCTQAETRLKAARAGAVSSHSPELPQLFLQELIGPLPGFRRKAMRAIGVNDFKAIGLAVKRVDRKRRARDRVHAAPAKIRVPDGRADQACP